MISVNFHIWQARAKGSESQIPSETKRGSSLPLTLERGSSLPLTLVVFGGYEQESKADPFTILGLMVSNIVENKE